MRALSLSHTQKEEMELQAGHEERDAPRIQVERSVIDNTSPVLVTRAVI